jgi:RNA polymerase sigma factor (sigma-70 family)
MTTPSPANRDDETAKLILHRDAEGLRRLLVDYGGIVQGLLRKEFVNLLDRHEIEEAVGDASAKLWRAGDRFDPSRGSPAAWLFAIARNCALDMVAAKARVPAVELVPDMDAMMAPASAAAIEAACCEQDGLSPEAFLADVTHCVDSMPERQRTVMAADMACGGRAPTARLADQMQASPLAVYAARSYGYKTLLAALRRLGYSLGREPVGGTS